MQEQDTPARRLCAECGAPLGRDRRRKYCRDSCQRARTARVWGIPPVAPQHRVLSRMMEIPEVDLSGIVLTGPVVTKGTKGAMSEYLAAVEMLRRGWYVFRSMSPSCPWDMVVALPDGRLFKIEVKSAVIERGTLYRGPLGPHNKGYDAVCYVTDDGIVVFEPPVEDWP